MKNEGKWSRRSVLLGATAAAALPLAGCSVMKTAGAQTPAKKEVIKTPPKKDGETRVVFIGGNYYHNGVAYEQHIRQVYADTDWTLYCAQADKFITPELLDTTDLLILVKESRLDAYGFSAQGLAAEYDEPTIYMTDDVEDAIVRNVTERGMGLFCMHSSTRQPGRNKFFELVGYEGPIDHGNPEMMTTTYLNPDHPITQGIPEYRIGSDQPRHVAIDESKVTVLMKAIGDQRNEEATFGWCVERGKGRVVAFLPGHEYPVWTNRNHQEIMWRAAHWALNRDIPERQVRRRGFGG